MISSKTKIGLLVAGHVVAGLLLAWMVYGITHTAFVGLYALVFAQAGLLGIWGALGTTRPMWRLPAVVTTTAYLCVLNITADRNWSRWSEIGMRYLLMIALPTAVIFLALSRLRHSRRRLSLAHSVGLSPTAERFQFTIRHLLLTTVVVAVVLAIGRGVRAFTDTESNVFVVSLAILVPWIIIVEMASLWAALGVGRPMPRLAVVVPTAFVVGAISFYYRANVIPVPVDWKMYVSESAILGLQAIITSASLLLIRSCGWRLVRVDRNDVEPPGS
jgi:hypothetical protein